MEEQKEKLSAIAQAKPYKIIISKPAGGEIPYRRIVIERKESYYQAAAYTEKQVFHENIPPEKLAEYLGKTAVGQYLQVNAWDDAAEHIYLCSKKGKVTYKTKKNVQTAAKASGSHNRKKQYILEEGTPIEPLVDMGVFTPEGKVVRTMYDKFRQDQRHHQQRPKGADRGAVGTAGPQRPANLSHGFSGSCPPGGTGQEKVRHGAAEKPAQGRTQKDSAKKECGKGDLIWETLLLRK